MESNAEKYYRDAIKSGLMECSDKQRTLFIRIYSHKNLDVRISDLVDVMPIDKLDHALFLINKTLKK